MPTFVCSYAYDIACYADFVVEAKTEKAAHRQIRKALREGRFENVSADPCWENGPDNERVFVQGPATEFASSGKDDGLPTQGQACAKTARQPRFAQFWASIRKLGTA